jgi:hypothetical protein
LGKEALLFSRKEAKDFYVLARSTIPAIPPNDVQLKE